MDRQARRDELIPKATKLPVYLWLALGVLVVGGYFLWAGRRASPVGPLPPLALVGEDAAPVPMAWFKEAPTVLFLFLPGEERSEAAAAEAEALRRTFEGSGVRFLGVSLAARAEEGRQAALRLGLGFPVATAKGNVLAALDVRGFPATLVVNAHAQVVARAEGINGPATLEPVLRGLPAK